MLTSLDPHSSYLAPKAAEDMRTQTRGEFGGLGIEVTMEEGFVKVVSPIDGTPAFDAGVEADLELTRDVIELTAARARTEGDSVVVRVTTFNDNTRKNIVDGLNKQVEEAGGLDNINGLVLDLRNNPGGLLSQAIKVADDFLEKGEIVSTRGRNPEEGERYNGCWRIKRSPSCDYRWNTKFRQRFGANGDAITRQCRDAIDHIALLHTFWALDPKFGCDT